MSRVRSGELPWTIIDDLHRMILDELVPEFSLEGLTEDELDDLNRVWHRLSPWSDAIQGLTRLHATFDVVDVESSSIDGHAHDGIDTCFVQRVDLGFRRDAAGSG